MEHDAHNKAGREDHCSSRPFNEKVLLVDACFIRHFRRDQIVANYCKEEVRELGKRLASELPLITRDLAEEFENLRTHNETQTSEFAASPNTTGCERVYKPPTEVRGVVLNEPDKVFVGGNSDVAALKLAIDCVVERLEQANKTAVADYEQKLRSKDQDVECMRNKMQAFEETVAEKTKYIDKLCEQITNKQSEIDMLKLHIQNFEAK
jgi:uncharacterized coiled-coil protein SlyX